MPDQRLELHSLLLCDHAITAQDGKVSAIGLFSQINVTRLPTVYGRFFIVAVLEADPGQHQLTFQVLGPSGQPMLARPPQLRLEVPPKAITANIVADLKGLQVRELGKHRLELRAASRACRSASSASIAWSCAPATACWAAPRSPSTSSGRTVAPPTPSDLTAMAVATFTKA
jgi:hypothetical protein